ncbi:MAG: hypothetical protein M0P61_10115 [Ignavibacteriaceae bacterium]|jgi:hypothetical protein|nr:hypothetical protein [Ignavibacteriaceae bacterium]
MKKYKVGLIAWENEANNRLKIKGKYFVVEFSKVNKDSHFSNGYEVIICTNNIRNARKVIQLIASSLAILNGGAFFTLDSLPKITPMQNDKEEIPRTYLGESVSSFSDIPMAAKISAKASFSKKNYLALLKYQLGCELHSNNIMNLYPEYFKLSKNPADHLRIAYAIILFYSVLEELGLEIRASAKNPSKINGVWNPIIKNDLEERLINSGIDVNEKLSWNLRSTPTKIEKLKKPVVSKKTEWASFTIRDSEIDIYEAILYASWLRSKIASHKLGDAFTSLSIYDVANINFLARHLLLSILDKRKVV